MQNLKPSAEEGDDEPSVDLVALLLQGDLSVLLQNNQPTSVNLVNGRPFVFDRGSAFPNEQAYQAEYANSGEAT